VLITESQIGYVTEMEKVGLKEFYYRRVVYIDTENDIEANSTNMLRIINFSACCLTAVLLIPRYW
jgi:hypothetical protein